MMASMSRSPAPRRYPALSGIPPPSALDISTGNLVGPPRMLTFADVFYVVLGGDLIATDGPCPRLGR